MHIIILLSWIFMLFKTFASDANSLDIPKSATEFIIPNFLSLKEVYALLLTNKAMYELFNTRMHQLKDKVGTLHSGRYINYHLKELKDQGFQDIMNGTFLRNKREWVFALLTETGTVITWGKEEYGAQIPDRTKMQLMNTRAIDIVFAGYSVAVLTYDRKVITWIGTKAIDKNNLKNIIKIYSNDMAFAAVTKEGKINTWGKDGLCDNNPVNDLPAMRIKHIYSCGNCNGGAFAVLLEGGNVITWGFSLSNGQMFRKIEENITEIYTNGYAFSGITDDKRVISWGDKRFGGNNTFVNNRLVGVEHIFSHVSAFAALNNKRELIFWGDSSDWPELYKKVCNQINVSITNYVLGNESNLSRILKQFPSLENYKSWDYNN